MTALPSALRRSGIYGLFRLDGGPVDPLDCACLGLPISPHSPSFAMQGVDHNDPAAVDVVSENGATTVLVGHIEQAPDLAARLALRRDTNPSRLAAAALDRFGEQLSHEMFGEWSLLRSNPDGGVMIVTSAARRDPLTYALSGTRLAVAPDLFRLAKLDWVGTEIDEAGLLSGMGRSDIRDRRGGQTMLRGVVDIIPGSTVTITPDGRVTTKWMSALTPQPRWHGSFDDAVAESEQLLRTIIRDRFARTARPAPMMSGGLDSSLIAWLTAQETAPGKNPLFITSVAPEGSGIADESAFADIVANHLDLPIIYASPAPEANTYRPDDKILSCANKPPMANRHCLTEAFQIAAREAGATMLVNGTYGEMNVTAMLPAFALRYRLRAIASRVRQGLSMPFRYESQLTPFHVKIAPHRLANLPDAIADNVARPDAPPPTPGPNDLLGYIWGAEKALRQGNEFYAGAIRADFPYRDLRLFRLFAGFPVKMLLSEGHDRPIVRRMLEGHLPDSIRLRRRGMPASPDHFARLQRQAAEARARIPVFRKADVDEWLDLDWLDVALARVAARGANCVDEANEVQLTAIAAEFLTWWRTRF